MPNEDELLRLGDEAQALLSADVFDKTVNDLVNQAFQAFCNSKPEDQDARERAFHHYRALVDIVQTLQQRVTVKDEIVAKLKTKANNKQEDS